MPHSGPCPGHGLGRVFGHYGVEVGDKVIAYTGDTEWTDDVANVARGADLLIAECYFYAKPIKWHLNYPAIAAHRRDFGAKRVILTHRARRCSPRPTRCPKSAPATAWW